MENDKVDEFKLKIKELENEINEIKENNEFLINERIILTEALKEAEDNLLKERIERDNDKKEMEELKSLSKSLYEKVKAYR